MASARTKTTFVHFIYIFMKEKKAFITHILYIQLLYMALHYNSRVGKTYKYPPVFKGRIRLRAGSGFFADFLGKKPESTLEIWIPWGNPVSSTLDPSGDPESLDPMAGSR